VPKDWDLVGSRWVRLQEVWGWQNAWASVRLASQLDQLYSTAGADASKSARDWLDVWISQLGKERSAMLDGRDQVDGEQRHVGYRRWRGSQLILTPISGQYRPMWRAALLRRIKKQHGQLSHSFALPGAEKRGWHCGAVITWGELPISCDSVRDEAQEPIRVTLHPTTAGKCRIALSRAVLLSALDAAALGTQGCHEWFGVPVVQHNASYAARAQWLHTDLVSISLVERFLFPQLFGDFVAAAAALWSGPKRQRAQLLEAAINKIAAITYFLFVSAMFTRGSAAIAILSHHSMYLWLLQPPGKRSFVARHRLQALRCLPNWRAGTMPDIEASATPTVAEYVNTYYWDSFDGKAKDTRTQVLSCLLQAFEPDTDSEWRGQEDAQRMQQTMRALGNLSSK